MARIALACPPSSPTGTTNVISASMSFGTVGSSAATSARAGTAHPASAATPSNAIPVRFIRPIPFVPGGNRQVTLRTGAGVSESAGPTQRTVVLSL